LRQILTYRGLIPAQSTSIQEEFSVTEQDLKESGSKDRHKQNVNMLDDESASDGGAEICVTEWVDTPMDKPITCPFLKPNASKRDEVKYTFDVSKYDKLFDILVPGLVIKLSEGHIVPSAEQLAKRKYCKWHDSYSHTTNECNYFHRQI
jgi:hypothetical protein